MKILFGMPATDSWGGPAACESPFVDALRKIGVEVSEETYIYGDKESPTPLISRVFRVVKTAIRFRGRLRRGDFDLLHLNSAFDRKTVMRDSISLFLMGSSRPKTFLKIHGASPNDIPRDSRLYRRLVRYLDSRVAGYGIFTHEEANGLRSLGLDASKFYFVRNAIDLGSAIPDGFVRSQKDASDIFELLFVSRFISTKGLLETIQAAAILLERGIDFTLYCLGDGPMRGEAEELVRARGLDANVIFTGYIPENEVAKRYLASDLFVFPTTHVEGFPIVLFKAAALGLPIVTTKIRAAAEYLAEAENCLFCTTDPADIADKIEQLIADKPMRERMSAANRKFSERLTPDVIAAEYLEIYRKICGEEVSISEPSDPPHLTTP